MCHVDIVKAGLYVKSVFVTSFCRLLFAAFLKFKSALLLRRFLKSNRLSVYEIELPGVIEAQLIDFVQDQYYKYLP